MVKNPPANAETGDTSSVPGFRRFPGGGNGNPFQYSYLEKLMDKGAWQATVHGVTEESGVIERLNPTTPLLLPGKSHVDGGAW